MNIMPLVGFYWRRHAQLSKMFGGGDGKNSRMAVDFAIALSPVVKKYWPHLNEDGLLDDAITSLSDAVANRMPTPD